MKKRNLLKLIIVMICFGVAAMFVTPVSAADMCACTDPGTGVSSSVPCLLMSCTPLEVETTCTCDTTIYIDEPCVSLCPAPLVGPPSSAGIPAPDSGDGGAALLRAGMNTAADVSGLRPTTATTVQAVAGVIIREALKYLSILFIILMLYGGIRWMTASGDSTKVKTARGIIINATIGLVITLTAYQIVAYIIRSIEIVG